MVISPPIQVATIGMSDSLLLMVIALVVLGPRRLPQVGRQIGKLMYEFRKASNDFKFQMEEELRNADEADRRKREEAERQRALTEAQQAVAQAQSAAAQALDAAAQAQSAAQTAQTAAELSHVPEAGHQPHEENALHEDPGYGAPEEAAAPTETGNIYDHIYAEPPATESGLRVQPPSTGEPVEAARPGRAEPGRPEPGRAATEQNATDAGAAEASATENEGSGADDAPLKKDVAADETPAATESTAHHG
jgi:sec-independent protein translocase protein TatB